MTRRRPGARRLLIVAGVAVLFLAPLHAQVDTGHLRLFKYLMGTSMRVEIYGATSSVRQQAADEAFAAIAQVDRGMSDYRDDSELARLNASAGRGAVPVSGPLFALLAAGERVWRASGGAFSTVSGSRGGDRPLVLDATTGSVRLGPADGRVSLNGLAKGFAAEVAAGSLARRGLSGTVDTGSVQFMIGRPPGKSTWTVGIEHPDRRGALLGAVEFEAGAVSTVTRTSVPVDPRTQRPTAPAVSATVISRDGTLAEALSRAALVLGPSAGLDLLARFPDTWGVIVARRTDGTLSISVSAEHTRAFHPSSPL